MYRPSDTVEKLFGRRFTTWLGYVCLLLMILMIALLVRQWFFTTTGPATPPPSSAPKQNYAPVN
ncbi:MAG TPA: hypothetical protein VEK08_14220 [Planctomycetota bacterium]|nr:hypothetical protein [Planctomycetota bacterium]